jgi:hypothetical protein
MEIGRDVGGAGQTKQSSAEPVGKVSIRRGPENQLETKRASKQAGEEIQYGRRRIQE